MPPPLPPPGPQSVLQRSPVGDRDEAPFLQIGAPADFLPEPVTHGNLGRPRPIFEVDEGCTGAYPRRWCGTLLNGV